MNANFIQKNYLYLNNEQMLELLLQGPYAHFKKVAHDDWRDPAEKNASLSISSKGYKDFKSGESGSLADLLTKHDLWPKESKSSKELTPETNKILRKKSPFTSHETQKNHQFNSELMTLCMPKSIATRLT